MESELRSLAAVSLCVAASMAYARFASARVAPGALRLLALLPVLGLLPFLPLSFSTVILRGISSFFLVWLAVFRLLLLSFADGPLSPDLPLIHFLLFAVLPIRSGKLSDPKAAPNQTLPEARGGRRLLSAAVKAAVLAGLVSLYRHRERIPRPLLLSMYSLHVYLGADLIFATAAAPAKLLLPRGLELEPQFDAPYRAASLGEFWSRRWNLVVSATLRPSVYLPVRARHGPATGVLAAFLVSGLMHEVIFWYLTVAPPTGEATAFFVLHGASVVAERYWKRRRPSPPSKVLAVPATLGFVLVTAFWLFFPAVLRNDVEERVVAEWTAVFGYSGRSLLNLAE